MRHQHHSIIVDQHGRITAIPTADHRWPPERWLVNVWRDEGPALYPDKGDLHVSISVPGEPVHLSIGDYNEVLRPGDPPFRRYHGPLDCVAPGETATPQRQPTMDRVTFIFFCHLLMAADPTLVNPTEGARLSTWADQEAERHGFRSWIDAFFATP